jgi:phosphoglycerate dehydrogenase-like enzyme
MRMDKGQVCAESTMTRREMLTAGGAILGGMAMSGQAFAQQSAANQTWTGKAFGDGLLSGKVAVITGAARGIGRAIAVDMAANGADIVGIDLCAKILQEVVGDVREIAALRETADKVEQQFGRIDMGEIAS